MKRAQNSEQKKKIFAKTEIIENVRKILRVLHCCLMLAACCRCIYMYIFHSVIITTLARAAYFQLDSVVVMMMMVKRQRKELRRTLNCAICLLQSSSQTQSTHKHKLHFIFRRFTSMHVCPLPIFLLHE